MTGAALSPLQGLQGALSQVVAVISLGYVLGTLKVIPVNIAKMIGRLYTDFCLPITFFVAVWELDWSSIDMKLAYAVYAGKAVSTVIVLIAGLTVYKPKLVPTETRLGLSCLHAFQISFPVGLAVLPNVFPGLWEYLFILDVVESVTLLPLPLILLEIGSAKTLKNTSNPELVSSPPLSSSDAAPAPKPPKSQTRLSIFLTILHHLLINPVMLCTFVGLVLNFATKRKIYWLIRMACKPFSDSVQFLALFSLGLTMVGKVREVAGVKLTSAAVLVFNQVFIRAGSTLAFANLFGLDSDKTNFAFVFGALPTAVFAFALSLKYGDVSLQTASTLLSFAVAGPFIYLIVCVMNSTNLKSMNATFESTSNIILQITIFCCIFNILLGVCIPARRRYPDCLVTVQSAIQLLYAALRWTCNLSEIVLIIKLGNWALPATHCFSVAIMISLLVFHANPLNRITPTLVCIGCLAVPVAVALFPISEKADEAYGCLLVFDSVWNAAMMGILAVVALTNIVLAWRIQQAHVRKPFPTAFSKWDREVDEKTGHPNLLKSDGMSDRIRFTSLGVYQAVSCILGILSTISINIFGDPAQGVSGAIVVANIIAIAQEQAQGIFTFLMFGTRGDAVVKYKMLYVLIVQSKLFKKFKSVHQFPIGKRARKPEANSEPAGAAELYPADEHAESDERPILA